MKLQRFTATTFSQAMNRVRKELGEDAIIVSSFEEHGLFHIVATIEEAHDSIPISKSQELSNLIDYHGLPAIAAKQLKEFIRSIGNESSDLSMCLASALDNILSFLPLNLKDLVSKESIRKNIPLAVIGPPGAGKTASIAKLAVEATILDLNPIVITLDAEKAGALAQLSSFTKALSIPFTKAETTEELIKLSSEHDGLTLIDTTGLNPYDQRQMDFAQQMLSSIQAKIMLVLPTGLDLIEAQDMMEIFKILKPEVFLITKLDMCRRLGTILGMSIHSGLPLTYYSNSPRISSPLTPFTALNFAHLMINSMNEPQKKLVS
jgi:flagellar biosynthesis protein FlhF